LATAGGCPQIVFGQGFFLSTLLPHGTAPRRTGPFAKHLMSSGEIEDPAVDNLESKLVENPLKIIKLSTPALEVLPEEKAFATDPDSVRDSLQKDLDEMRTYIEGCISVERLERQQQFNAVRAIAEEFREQAASIDEALESMQEDIATTVLSRLEKRMGQDEAAIHSSSSSEDLARESKVTASQLQDLDMKFCHEAQALGEALSAEASKLRREFCDALRAEHCEWTRLSQDLDVERQRGRQCLEALALLEISFGELRQYLKSARSPEEKSQATTIRDRLEQLERKVAMQCSEQHQTSEEQAKRVESLEKAQRLSKDVADIAYNKLEDVIVAVEHVKSLQLKLQDRCHETQPQPQHSEQSQTVRQAETTADAPSAPLVPDSLASMVVEDAQSSEEDAVHQHVRPRPALISLMKTEDATGGTAQYGKQMPDRTCPVPTMVRRSLSLGVLPGQTWAARSQQAPATVRTYKAAEQTSQPAPTEALEHNLNRLARDITRTLQQLHEQGEVCSRSPSPRRTASIQALPPEASSQTVASHSQSRGGRPAGTVEGNFRNLTRPATEVTARSSSVQLPPSFPRAATPYRGQQLPLWAAGSISTPRMHPSAQALPAAEVAGDCRGHSREAPVNVVRRQVSLPGGDESAASSLWAAQCRPYTYAFPAAPANAWQPHAGDPSNAPLPSTRVFRSPSPLNGTSHG